MNKNLKRKWLRALRSGRYKQGKYYLRNSEDRYCCLGVLCECLEKPKWNDMNGYYKYKDRYVGTVSKRILSDKIQNTLIDLNDSECMSFLEIADYIKNNIKETESRTK